MYIKVHKPIKSIGNNTGSSNTMVNYLSKEDSLKKDYDSDFFSHSQDNIDGKEVVRILDNNKRTLKTKAVKFYMLTINPSDDELKHLIKICTGKEVSEFSELTNEEKKIVISELKVYSRSCMNRYASLFRREKVKDGNDIVYFGRIETERKYKNTDDAVKEENATVGDAKKGLNLHIHIVVSRMDKTQTVSLSPMANSKGSITLLNGRKVITGFQRTEWSALCYDDYIKKYGYRETDREDKYSDSDIMKHEAMYMAKTSILQNEFRKERQMYHLAKSMTKFVFKVKRDITKTKNYDKGIF